MAPGCLTVGRMHTGQLLKGPEEAQVGRGWLSTEGDSAADTLKPGKVGSQGGSLWS